ncbi:clasp N terminal-domain-containing protein [Polychytrium aggregatum]|uniref:clasp N terminal-domain-containing protein n=1 Tax=Polychytrium aggregatum TaxID=110093 RepID=UPI0022FED32E|nr:clasp N terminal-domain-containing protein [Polychytrium aggregatum]KAI9204197.1 clasp N terminal-domain-containing protein [Polychytrium aggregatum]
MTSNPIEAAILAAADNEGSSESRIQAFEQLRSQLDIETRDTELFVRYEDLLDVVAKASRSLQPRLSGSALACISPLLRCLSRASPSLGAHLRLFSGALLQVLIKKLTDAKQQMRDVLIQSLVDYYGALLSLSAVEGGSVPGITLAFEREIKTNGLGSDIPRVRESSALWLAQSFETLPEFPLKQYLPILIKLLEDSSETVRAVSKETVLKIYRSTQNPAVKAGIKKELKSIRASIADTVVAELVDSPPPTAESIGRDSTPRPTLAPPRPTSRLPVGTGSDPNEAKKSIKGGTRAPEPKAIDFSTFREFEAEVAGIISTFQGAETEHNWNNRDNAFQRLRSICRGNAVRMEGFLPQMKLLLEPILRTLVSLRTALQLTTLVLVSDMANCLGPAIDPIAEDLIAATFKVTSTTKKLVITASTKALTALFQHTSYNSRNLQLCSAVVADKNMNVRNCALMLIKASLELMSQSEGHRLILEKSGLEIVEKCVRKGLEDPTAANRELGRDCVLLLKTFWPKKAESMMDSFDAQIKKNIEKHKPGGSVFESLRTASVPTPLALPVVSESGDSIKPRDVAPTPRRSQSTSVLPMSLARKTSSLSLKSELKTPSRSKAPQMAEEAQIYELLKAGATSRIDALQDLQTLLGSRPLKPAFARKISDAILEALQNDASFQNHFLSAQWSQTLISLKVLTLEQLVGPLIYVRSKAATNEGTGEQAEQALSRIAQALDPSAFLESISRLFSSPSIEGLNRRKMGFREYTKIEEQVISWLAGHFLSLPAEAHRCAFEKPATLRTFLNKLVPMFSSEQPGGSLDSLVRGQIARMLKQIASSNPDGFSKAITTFDSVLVEAYDLLPTPSPMPAPQTIQVPKDQPMLLDLDSDDVQPIQYAIEAVDTSQTNLVVTVGGQISSRLHSENVDVDMNLTINHPTTDDALNLLEGDLDGVSEESFPDGFLDTTLPTNMTMSEISEALVVQAAPSKHRQPEPRPAAAKLLPPARTDHESYLGRAEAAGLVGEDESGARLVSNRLGSVGPVEKYLTPAVRIESVPPPLPIRTPRDLFSADHQRRTRLEDCKAIFPTITRYQNQGSHEDPRR